MRTIYFQKEQFKANEARQYVVESGSLQTAPESVMQESCQNEDKNVMEDPG